MILSFSTQINGKPTYFVEKIWKSLRPIDIAEFIVKIDMKYITPYYKKHKLLAKLHTIREDNADRWKKGVIIDFFINARQKNMFRFCHRLPVISTQTVFFDYFPEIDKLNAIVDGKHLSSERMEILALNDGFENYEDFKNYFKKIVNLGSPKRMKIIHWTDFKY